QPDAPAVSAGDQILTYGELNRRAAETAQRLVAAGIGPGDVVAQCAWLAPELDGTRLELMAADSGAAVVYAAPGLAGRLAGQPTPIGAPTADHRDDPEDPAPSPTTGPDSICCLYYPPDAPHRPVGVPLRHDSAVNL